MRLDRTKICKIDNKIATHTGNKINPMAVHYASADSAHNLNFYTLKPTGLERVSGPVEGRALLKTDAEFTELDLTNFKI